MLGMNDAGLYRYLRVFESDQHGTFCGRWGCPHLTHLACARLYTRLAPEAHDTMNTLLDLVGAKCGISTTTSTTFSHRGEHTPADPMPCLYSGSSG